MPKVLSSSTIQGIFYLSSSTSISSFCRKVVVFYTRFGLLSTFANSEQTIVDHSSLRESVSDYYSSSSFFIWSYRPKAFPDCLGLKTIATKNRGFDSVFLHIQPAAGQFHFDRSYGKPNCLFVSHFATIFSCNIMVPMI